MIAARSSVSRLNLGLRALAYDNPLYNLSLGGRRVSALAAVPADPWPGSAQRGAALLSGHYRFAGQSHEPVGTPLEERFWFPKGADGVWHHAMQSFEWLRDLRAHGGDEARRLARTLTIGWLEWNALWTDLTWIPELLGPRIANWVGTHDFFWASADEGFRYCVLDSLARQTRHLVRLVPGRLSGETLLLAAKGLAYGSLCVTDGEACRDLARRLLDRALPLQLLADGGHAARCPSLHLRSLRHLIDIRSALRAARSPVPDPLQQAVERMAPVLRTFRHGDGGLGVFNGGFEERADLVEAVLTQANGRARPLRSLTHTKFQRLVGGRSVVVFDAGEPPAPGNDQFGRAGTLSFEFSTGRDRIVVNCGRHPADAGPWRQALAASAAHSTLILAETNSAEVLPDGGIGRRPAAVTCERIDLDDATMVVARHDGYAKAFHLIHRRQLWLAETGLDLRGEDMLEPDGDAQPEPQPFTIRFHLHPAVNATVADALGLVRLELASGLVWYFSAPGHALELAESIYLGAGEEPQVGLQIVIAGETGPQGATVKWFLHREGEDALLADPAAPGAA